MAAVVVAILALAFTNPKGETLSPYYYFEFVNNTLQELPPNDPTSTSDPYGCPAVSSNICTRAYAPNDTEINPVTLNRRPKSGATIQIEIKKP